jgi:hypothetical protein
MGKFVTPVRLYLIGTVVSLIAAIAANLLTPGTLTTNSATFAIFVPLAVILVVDRLTAQRDALNLRDEILADIRDSGTGSGQLISLGSGDAWVKYIERNAVRAKAIFNTRLSGFEGLFDTYHHRIDDAILKAVQSGTDYNFICAESRRQSLVLLRQHLPEPNLRKASRAGRVRAYSFNAESMPLLQMKIFDYKNDSSEAMLGFLATSAHAVSQPIFLVRDPVLVEYLRHVFNSYCDHAFTKREL